MIEIDTGLRKNLIMADLTLQLKRKKPMSKVKREAAGLKDVKITILKKQSNKDLIEEYTVFGKEPYICDKFEEGQQFISRGLRMPDGFCSWAWADIQRDVAILSFGANYPSTKKKGTVVVCCTDAYRPVVFKLERID